MTLNSDLMFKYPKELQLSLTCLHCVCVCTVTLKLVYSYYFCVILCGIDMPSGTCSVGMMLASSFMVFSCVLIYRPIMSVLSLWELQ